MHALPEASCALLLCSGAGKSTFFGALTGSARSYGRVGGQLRVNGAEVPLERYSDVLGFVPQDDIVHEVCFELSAQDHCLCGHMAHLFTLLENMCTLKFKNDVSERSGALTPHSLFR